MQAVLCSAGKERRDIVFDKVGPKFGDTVTAIPSKAPAKPRAATRAGKQHAPARKKRVAGKEKRHARVTSQRRASKCASTSRAPSRTRNTGAKYAGECKSVAWCKSYMQRRRGGKYIYRFGATVDYIANKAKQDRLDHVALIDSVDIARFD